MISDQGTFDYEAVVSPAASGVLGGLFVSLQERNGYAPGPLGSTPRLHLEGDRLRIEAHPGQLRIRPVWQYLSLLVPPLFWYLEHGQRRRASASSAELTVSGLSRAVEGGQILRVKFDPNQAFDLHYRGPPKPQVADVSLFQNEQLVNEWRETPIRFVPFFP